MFPTCFCPNFRDPHPFVQAVVVPPVNEVVLGKGPPLKSDVVVDGRTKPAGKLPRKLTFSHLKMDGWNTRPSFWGPAYFEGANC